MSFPKLEKFLFGLLFFLVMILVIEAFLIYQKGYYKSLFKKPTALTITPPESAIKAFPVSAVSDIKGYSLKIINPKLLNQYLEEFGFVAGKSFLVFGAEKPQEIKELIVHLTDKEQPFLQAKVGEEVVYSVGNYFEGKKLHFLIYAGNQLDKEGINLGFDRTFLEAFYLIGEEPVNGLPGDKFENIFKDFRTKNQQIFSIVKK